LNLDLFTSYTFDDDTQNFLKEKLQEIPRGESGWRDYQALGIEIFNYLFVPDLLSEPYEQWVLDADGVFDYSSSKRPDAVYPISSDEFINEVWKNLFGKTCMFVAVDFKNLSSAPSSEDVEQVAGYLSDSARRKIGILCSRQKPGKSALQARYRAWNEDENLILFVTDEDIKEMIELRYDNINPSMVLARPMYRFFSKLP
jgi:hypothetical protein